MAEIQSKCVQVGDLELHYLEAGEGPAVLFLHGWPTHSQLYRHVLPVVGESRRAIALDLPGFGRSSKPLDASYSFRFYDRLISEFLEALGIEKIGLVVHDLGGPIGLHWAVGNKERLTDLTLLNTLVFPEMSWAVKLFVGASMMPVVRGLLSSPRGLAAAMRFGVVNKSQISPEVAAMYQEPFVSQASRKALLKTAHALHMKGFATIANGLADIEVPVRMIYGSSDRILPHVGKTMQRVGERIPHAEITAIADCGHFLQEDRPEEVTALLADFLSSSVA
ncbi:MAG: alpha/beta fold hydrolase [Proteobacteria bacterium]|nr:alpha/beta fold hydrolase [Pseudomonadota bacterium]